MGYDNAFRDSGHMTYMENPDAEVYYEIHLDNDGQCQYDANTVAGYGYDSLMFYLAEFGIETPDNFDHTNKVNEWVVHRNAEDDADGPNGMPDVTWINWTGQDINGHVFVRVAYYADGEWLTS